jgi:hypothetical protein
MPNRGVLTAVAAVGLLALIAGGAAAASRYLITSTKQIKPGVLAQLHGARGPSGANGAAGGAGPQGSPGAQGNQGPAGPAGMASVQRVTSPPVAYCSASGGACSVATATASCPTGSVVVGGAAAANSTYTPISTIASATSYAAVSNDDGPFTGQLTATAICASGPGVQAAASDVSSASASDAARKLVAKLRGQRLG